MPPAYVGSLSADGRTFRARQLDSDDGSSTLIPTLAAVWRYTFDRNARAMTEALLSYDWHEISFTATAAAAETDGAGSVLVPGVGVAVPPSSLMPIKGDVESSDPAHATAMYLMDGVGRARLFYFTAGTNWQLAARLRLQEVVVPPSQQ